jgi:hypothetical protein
VGEEVGELWKERESIRQMERLQDSGRESTGLDGAAWSRGHERGWRKMEEEEVGRE